MSEIKPLLHDQAFGGSSNEPEYPVPVEWVGKFKWMGDATWAFVFLDENANEEWLISGVGATPRAAFEGCVQAYIALNAGAESPTLRKLLPMLREFFNLDGGVKLEHLLDLHN